jgi:hypothetical protein
MGWGRAWSGRRDSGRDGAGRRGGSERRRELGVDGWGEEIGWWASSSARRVSSTSFDDDEEAEGVSGQVVVGSSIIESLRLRTP